MKNVIIFFSFFNFSLKNLYYEKYSQNAYGNQKKIKSTFDKIINLPISKSDNKNRVKRCVKFLNKNDKIFDIGCGLSVFLYELKKRVLKFFWIRTR